MVLPFCPPLNTSRLSYLILLLIKILLSLGKSQQCQWNFKRDWRQDLFQTVYGCIFLHVKIALVIICRKYFFFLKSMLFFRFISGAHSLCHRLGLFMILVYHMEYHFVFFRFGLSNKFEAEFPSSLTGKVSICE